jgi:tellurite resistance protein TehA-like permease
MAEFVPYHTSINPALYPTLATLFLVVGLLFVAYFFVYEITSSAESSRRKRNLTKEISIAFPASLFLGFGSLFLLLWTNVYV